MPKDERLYGRFTLDFADNHKILPLSDSAFRTLVEMTLYSRKLLSDGFITEAVAKKKWKPRAIAELMKNDPERPSLYAVVGGYMIHDYSQQQDTRAEVEARRQRNAENGRRGGLARAKRVASKSPSQSLSEPVSEIQAETERETKTTTSKEVVRADKRGSRVPESFALTDSMRLWARENVPLVNIDKCLPEFIDYWKSVAGERGVKLDWEATWHNGMRKQQEFALRDGLADLTAPSTRRVVTSRVPGQRPPVG